MNISCYMREKTPKYSGKLAEEAKNLCKKLENLLYRSSCYLILVDEKYFTYDGSNMQGNNNYYSSDMSKCPDRVRFAEKEKYLNKEMVWESYTIVIYRNHYFRRSPRPSIWTFI